MAVNKKWSSGEETHINCLTGSRQQSKQVAAHISIFPLGQFCIAGCILLKRPPAHPLRLARLAEQVADAISKRAPQRPALGNNALAATGALARVRRQGRTAVRRKKSAKSGHLSSFRARAASARAVHVPVRPAVGVRDSGQPNDALRVLALTAAVRTGQGPRTVTVGELGTVAETRDALAVPRQNCGDTRDGAGVLRDIQT